MKVVLATHNRDKVKEIRRILAGLDLEMTTVDDYDDVPEPVEDGETLTDNAIIKAREIRDFTGVSAIADDTGLEVDALNGAPGIYAARFAGEDASYEDNCNKLIHDMDGVEAGQRGAAFKTVIALALNPEDRNGLGGKMGDVMLAEGILHGTVATSRRGVGGFGYDPVFVDNATGKSLAELTPEEKNSSSHRYRALVEMRELMLRLGLVSEI